MEKYVRITNKEYEQMLNQPDLNEIYGIVSYHMDYFVPEEIWNESKMKLIEILNHDLHNYFESLNIPIEYYFHWDIEYDGDDKYVIYPEGFDEDYGGEMDKDIEKIGLKYGVRLHFTSGIYSK